MSDVHVDVRYRVDLSGAEFRVVTLALAGKLKGLDDKQAALQLNAKLLEQRAAHASEIAKVAQGALAAAVEERKAIGLVDSREKEEGRGE